MPRQARYRITGISQLVLQRGHNRQPAFKTADDYRTYIESVRMAALDSECAVHAYRLMFNAVYLLCTPQVDDGVSRLMQSIGRRYTAYFNQTHRRSGTLWDGRYRACLVEPGGYLLACYRFVENQSSDERGVDWSSYRHHGLESRDPLLIDHWVYRNLGSCPHARCTAYRELLRTPLNPTTIEAVEAALHHCLVLGSEAFKDKIETTVHTRVRLGRPGRPPKNAAPRNIEHGAANADGRDGSPYDADAALRVAVG